jgi:ABC-type multidrug transport system ATPase subunit
MNLSGGNKRKLCVAMALVASPKLCFLDEPSTGLDPIASDKLWKVIKAHSAQIGTAFIFATHWMHEAENLCHEVALLMKGKLMTIGSNEYLKDKYTKE